MEASEPGHVGTQCRRKAERPSVVRGASIQFASISALPTVCLLGMDMRTKNERLAEALVLSVGDAVSDAEIEPKSWR